MQKINFVNLPNTTTPLNATNLNQLQTNVENDIKVIDTLRISSNTIPENSDLDNYMTAGVYLSTNGSISATLTHTPVTTSGFKMTVGYFDNANRIVQTIRVKNENTSAIWVRTNTGSWGAWKKINMENKVELYSGDLTSGTATLSDNIANYTEVEIRYRVQDNINSERLKASEITSRTDIILSGLNQTGNFLQPYALKLGFTSGVLATTITHNGCVALNVNTSTFAITAATLNCRVLQVIGYNY